MRGWDVVAGGRHECAIAAGLVDSGTMRGIAAVVGTALIIDTDTVGGGGVCCGRRSGCGKELAVEAPCRRAAMDARFARLPGVRVAERVLTAVGSTGWQANRSRS
jgi:hypothetical protein